MLIGSQKANIIWNNNKGFDRNNLLNIMYESQIVQRFFEHKSILLGNSKVKRQFDFVTKGTHF